METKDNKKEPLSPEREKLEITLKEIEIDYKRQELDAQRQMDAQEIERRELEIEDLRKQGSGFQTPIDQLLSIARTCTVDNDKSLPGSEPSLMSIWSDSELAEIKKLILKKAREL
jgi:hypothetical protein